MNRFLERLLGEPDFVGGPNARTDAAAFWEFPFLPNGPAQTMLSTGRKIQYPATQAIPGVIIGLLSVTMVHEPIQIDLRKPVLRNDMPTSRYGPDFSTTLRCDRAVTSAVRGGVSDHRGIPTGLKPQPLRPNWIELNWQPSGSIPVSATNSSITYGHCAGTRCHAYRLSRIHWTLSAEFFGKLRLWNSSHSRAASSSRPRIAWE